MSTEKYRILDSISFEEVFSRVRESTPIKNISDLKDVVEIAQSAISRRKQQNIWPLEWAVKIAFRYNLLTEWLLTGQGPKTLEDDGGTGKYDFKVLNDLNSWLNELVVGEPHRRDWFLASIEDSFPMFREWKKRREKEESRSDIDPHSNVA